MKLRSRSPMNASEKLNIGKRYERGLTRIGPRRRNSHARHLNILIIPFEVSSLALSHGPQFFLRPSQMASNFRVSAVTSPSFLFGGLTGKELHGETGPQGPTGSTGSTGTSLATVWASSGLTPHAAIVYFPLAEGVCTPARTTSGFMAAVKWRFFNSTLTYLTVSPTPGDNVEFGPFIVPVSGTYQIRITVDPTSGGLWALTFDGATQISQDLSATVASAYYYTATVGELVQGSTHTMALVYVDVSPTSGTSRITVLPDVRIVQMT